MSNLRTIFFKNFLITISSTALLFYLFDHFITTDINRIEDKELLLSVIDGKLLILFFAITIIYISIIFRFNRKLKREIHRIDVYLNEINQKRYKQKIKLQFSEEFYLIGLKLKRVIHRIRKRDKRKLKDRARLKLANQQQEQLIGAISHELKNPMSSILGYSQLLSNELKSGEPLSDIHLKFLNKVIANSYRIDNLLSRLRLAVQLESNRFQLELQFFNLTKVINSAIDSTRQDFHDRKVVVNIESYQLYADYTLIELVLINLIENGLKYSDKDVHIEVVDNCLRVVDYGIGIDNIDLPHIKKRFFRVSENRHLQSMGLGLAIVEYILKLHNLRLEVESEVGKGSIFSINLLPIKKPSLPAEIETISRDEVSDNRES